VSAFLPGSSVSQNNKKFFYSMHLLLFVGRLAVALFDVFRFSVLLFTKIFGFQTLPIFCFERF